MKIQIFILQDLGFGLKWSMIWLTFAKYAAEI